MNYNFTYIHRPKLLSLSEIREQHLYYIKLRNRIINKHNIINKPTRMGVSNTYTHPSSIPPSPPICVENKTAHHKPVQNKHKCNNSSIVKKDTRTYKDRADYLLKYSQSDKVKKQKHNNYIKRKMKQNEQV